MLVELLTEVPQERRDPCAGEANAQSPTSESLPTRATATCSHSPGLSTSPAAITETNRLACSTG